MLKEFMADPFFFWAAVTGLFAVSVMALSSGWLMLTVAVAAFNRARLRKTYSKIGHLLYDIAIKNQDSNPDLSQLCKVLIKELDPSSDLFDSELPEIRRRLNIEPLGEVADDDAPRQ